MATLKIACKLPNGLVIDVKGKQATLVGANSSELINGFGVTEVDAELWNAWLAEHKTFPAVVNGLIFAQTSDANVKAQTREHEAQETGLEGVDPANPGKKAKIAPSQIAQA